MPSNPDICDCQSQLFTAIWAVSNKDDNRPDNELDPKRGNTTKRPVGFKCIECGAVQLTREVPERHAKDKSLEYPDKADRDMVRESNDNDDYDGRFPDSIR